MLAIITLFYYFVIFVFVLIYFFILYHLAKYSVNSELNRIMIPFFTLVSVGLLFSNILLFYSVSWDELLSRFYF